MGAIPWEPGLRQEHVIIEETYVQPPYQTLSKK